MALPKALSAALCVFALTAPGSAFAAGAGDEQYQDPLAAPEQTTPAPSTTPAETTAPAATTPAATPVAAAAPAAELPRTGAETGLVAALGALSLAAGLGLRRRLPDN